MMPHSCILTVHHTRKQPSGDSFEMISGTTGLLGCADGALLMQKKKRTALEATIDVAGRDQQDQILYLTKDAETQIWNLTKVENEPHREPPDPILESVSRLISDGQNEWTGSPTELAEALRTDKIEFQIEKDKAKLADTRKKLQGARADVLSDAEIDSMGKQTITGKVLFSEPEASHLKALAKEAISSKSTIYQLKNDLGKARQDAHAWKSRYEKIKVQFDTLKEQVKGYLAALERAPERVMTFIDRVLRTAPEQIELERNRAVEQPQKHKKPLWKQDVR